TGRFQIRDSEPRRKGEGVSPVPLATAKDRCVGCEAKRLVARLDRAVDELLRDGAVLIHIELEPSRSVRRGGDLLQGFRRDRAGDENRFRGRGPPRCPDLALRMDEGLERGG